MLNFFFFSLSAKLLRRVRTPLKNSYNLKIEREKKRLILNSFIHISICRKKLWAREFVVSQCESFNWSVLHWGGKLMPIEMPQISRVKCIFILTWLGLASYWKLAWYASQKSEYLSHHSNPNSNARTFGCYKAWTGTSVSHLFEIGEFVDSMMKC